MSYEQKTWRTILLKENILTGANYIDGYRKLKIILKAERTLYILTDPEMNQPPLDASDVLAPNAVGQCSIPGQGTRSHRPQRRLKILWAATKTQHNQINKY